MMEEERFVWSIWRTQVSTLKWIKLGREAGRELANMTGVKSQIIHLDIFYRDESGGGVALAGLFVKGNWGMTCPGGRWLKT